MSKGLLWLLVAGLGAPTLALHQADHAPFSITISAANNVVKAGSEVRIRLVFKNTSAEHVPYKRSPGEGVEPRGEFFTDVEVRDARGELVSETKYHRALRGKVDTSANRATPERSDASPAISERPEPRPFMIGSFVRTMLKPGEFREEDIVISNLYDLSQPGQYTVSASRHLSNAATDAKSKLVAKSNTLMITITK